MKNTEIIYSAMHEKYDGKLETVDTQCFICGKKIQEGSNIKNVLSGNFTNFDLCKDIHSKYICKECAACIKEPSLRRNNIIADKNNLYLLKKNDLEKYLFNMSEYVKGEFIVGITTSFKKHNSFRCRVNSNPNRFFIRQEDKEYMFDAEKLKTVYEMLNEAYLQISKDELETGNYKMMSIEQFGIEKFEKYEDVFRQYRGSNQFSLLIYILNSEKRNEYVKAKLEQEKAAKKAAKNNKKKVEAEQICMI